MIKFIQKALPISYIDFNTKLIQKAKNNFEKDCFKPINNSVLGKTMDNVTSNKNFQLVTTEKKGKYLASDPNFHTTKLFTENLLAIKMRKTHKYISLFIYCYQY